MNIDEITLRAYVDGELDAQMRTRVETALAHDAALREKVAALRASCLPYRSAYDAVVMPAMPASLEHRVASLISVANAKQATPSMNRRYWFSAAAGLIAAFALGALVPALFHTQQGTQSSETPWVEAIASYQAFYVRETVEQAADDATRATRLLGEFDAQQKTALAVPNLQDAGLSFKRIQRLGYGDAPLIQMVYLPSEGKPAALCVLPVRKGDAPIKMQSIDGLAVAAWQKNGLAYVLTADMSQSRAEAIAKKIADGAFAPLYASAS
jgi:anti-sigma factor RsiW